MSHFLDHPSNLVIMLLVVIHMWIGFRTSAKNELAGAVMSSAAVLSMVALHIWGRQ